jgi:hypothetical protein
MPSPRRESQTGPTTASSYVLERKLLRAYEALYKAQIGAIWHPATRRAAQVEALGGLDRAATRNGYAEARLTEGMPELIQKLTAEQQPAVAELLLCECPDLASVVKELVRLERNINYRDEDPRLKTNDDGRMRAAGMGSLSKTMYGEVSAADRAQLRATALKLEAQASARKKRPALGDPLVLTPWPPQPLRTKKRAPARTVLRVSQKQLSLWPRELLAGGVREGGL